MTNPTYNTNDVAVLAALDGLRQELAQIPGDRLDTIRLDINDAVVTALGSLDDVLRLREEVAVRLGESDRKQIDRLEQAALACWAAHRDYLALLQAGNAEALADDLGQKRRVLLLEAEALVATKRMPRSRLGQLEGGTGYKAMCLDVLQLATAFRADWPSIERFTPVTTAELDEAEALSKRLAKAVGDTEHGTSKSETADMRQRAYTLFLRTYDEVRRALTYVRWKEGDADVIAPSLFAGRKRHKDDDDEPEAPLPPGVPPANMGPVPPGAPGGSPFVS